MIRTVVAACGTALVLGMLIGPADAASAPGSCPVAFHGPATFEDILLTPEVEAGLEAGVYDEAHVRLRFDQVDTNGDALVCWKSIGNDNQVRLLYAGNYVDNNAAPK